MSWLKIEEYSTGRLLIIVALIILFVPPLLTLPNYFGFPVFSLTGQIGDTIGGLTAPFINGLSAILIFIAFKAQIVANKELVNSNMLLKQSNDLLTEQENARTIQDEGKSILDQIVSIQNLDIGEENTFTPLFNRIQNLNNHRTVAVSFAMNRALHLMFEIQLTLELILNHKGKKDFLYRKLYYLYNRYRQIIDDFNVARQSTRIHEDYEESIKQFVMLNDYLKDNFVRVDRFKDQ